MSKLVRSFALVIAGVAAATLSPLHFSCVQAAAQRGVRPGELSQPHAFLENNCAACHAAMKGVEAKNCIVCQHEHQGRIPATPKMDHAALARMGLRQIPPEPDQPDKTRDDFATWFVQGARGAPPSATPQLQH